MPGSHPDYQVNVAYFDVKTMRVSPFKMAGYFLVAMDRNSLALKAAQ